MDYIFYTSFSIIFLSLGFVSTSNLKYKGISLKGIALKGFIYLTTLLPITKVILVYHLKYQVSVYYFFFIPLVFLYFEKLLFSRYVKKKTFDALVLILLFIILYIIYLFINPVKDISAINILKDIKPFVLIFLSFLFIDYYKDSLKSILTKKFCERLILYYFIISTTFFYLLVKYNLHLVLTDDKYFTINEFRYETIGNYFGIIYILNSIFQSKKLSFKIIMLVLLPTLYTGNRTLLFSILLIIIIYYLLKMSAKRIKIFASIFGFLFLILSYFINIANELSPLFRFQKLYKAESIIESLVNRYSPFIETIKSYNISEYFIGTGFGQTFFIPWFTWRDHIDDYNIYVDSLYLTLYAKYGVFFIVTFILMYYYLSTYLSKQTRFYFFLMILIISVTNAMVYQFNFLWIFILLAMPFRSDLGTSAR
jgi:hypothetical protein